MRDMISSAFCQLQRQVPRCASLPEAFRKVRILHLFLQISFEVRLHAHFTRSCQYCMSMQHQN